MTNNSLCIMRPVREDDLDALCHLASQVKGMTNLPDDRGILTNRVYESLKGFNPHVNKPAGELYLFVMEDTVTKEILGTSCIASKVGGFEPFYSYEIRTEIYESENPKVHKEIKTLHPIANHSGPSEVCGLYLSPTSRRSGLGRLLSLSRFLFMAEFPNRFDKKVIAEMRGYITPDGISPFWECVGKHFFNIDFYEADYLSATGNKTFIEELMPEHPLYIPMLPHEVQAVIGKVHVDTEPARKLLESEGFAFESHVDIFDAGPTLECNFNDIRSVKNSKVLRVSVGLVEDGAPEHLVSNLDLDFRAGFAPAIEKEGQLILDKDFAKALSLKDGDKCRSILFRA